MSAQALREWQQRLGWSDRRAARELGVSRTGYQQRKAGKHSSRGTPCEPDRLMLLACAALEHGHGPVCSKSPESD